MRVKGYRPKKPFPSSRWRSLLRRVAAPEEAAARTAIAAPAELKVLATPGVLVAEVEDAASAALSLLTACMLMDAAELYVTAALPAVLLAPTALKTAMAFPR